MKAVLFFVLFYFLPTNTLLAKGIYQTPSDFVQQVYASKPPKPAILWIKSTLKQQVKQILGHRYKGLRVRYWLKEGVSVWILNEIGKELPITIAVVVNQQKIQQIKVLEFRESRGWEVKHDFFTEQFLQVSLTDDYLLNQSIDGITGATLSVRAMKKMARLALLFDQQVNTTQ